MTKTADAGTQSPVSAASPRTWLAVATSLLILLAVNLPPWVPLQDFNEWAYQGYIGAQLLQHRLTDQFALAPFPVPNSLIQAMLIALDLVLRPAVSGRIVANLYAVLALALAWKLAHRISATRPASYFLVLLFCTYFNTAFWSGYLNFQFGILIFTAWLLCDERTRSQPLVVLAFSMLAFFTHAIVWTAILLMMALDALKDRRLLARLPALASVVLFVWYVRCKPAQEGFKPVSQSGLVKTLAYKFYTFAKFGPYHNFMFSDVPRAGAARLAHLAGSAVNVACALGLIWIAGSALLAAWRQRSADTAIVAAMLLLAAFTVLPPIVANVINPGERMLCLALLLCITRTPAARTISVLSLGAMVLLACAASLTRVDTAQWNQRVSLGLAQGNFVDNLFWSRPAQFVPQVKSAEAGQARLRLTFHTSFVINKGGRAGAS